MVCIKGSLPFSNLDEKKFILKRISNKTQFMYQINLTSSCEDNNITKNFHKQEFRDLLQSCNKKKYLKALHLNISSLPYHCSELHSLLSSCKINFDITKISESKVKRNQRALQNIDIPNYNIEYYPTEGSYGGTLIYIRKGII